MYKAKKQFTSMSGRKFKKNQEINENDYLSLTADDQLNFVKQEDAMLKSTDVDDEYSAGNVAETAIAADLLEGDKGNTSSKEDDPAFEGFQGGSSGGGGATGSWDADGDKTETNDDQNHGDDDLQEGKDFTVTDDENTNEDEKDSEDNEGDDNNSEDDSAAETENDDNNTNDGD